MSGWDTSKGFETLRQELEEEKKEKEKKKEEEEKKKEEGALSSGLPGQKLF